MIPASYCKTYTYDLAGNRTGFTLEKDGETVHNIIYSYDNLNRLLTVSENGTVEATYTYDTNGNRASLTLGNGVVTTYSYNLANWVTNLYNTKSSGGIISSYSYEYYASGNQKSKTDNTGAVTTYIYDDLGRLTQESESDGTVLSYSYDAAGNRARLTATGIESYVVDYSYNAANQLTSEVKTIGEETETTTYTYDGNGNTLTVNAPESLQVNTYNLFNQLTATNINGSSSAYVYNTAGIRTVKTVDNVTTVFLLDGGNVVAESQNGEITATYLRGANLISRETDTAELYYIFNAHGDVTALTNDAQTVTKTYDYDAFGNEKNPSASDQNPFRYCGEYFDKETGTYYLRARYYDPNIGRFTQQDTHWNVANMIYGDIPNKINESQDALGLKAYTYAPSIGSIMQSGNLYAYCLNNPIFFADINGKFIISATTAIIIAGAAIFGTIGGCIGNHVANEHGATGMEKLAYITGYASIGALAGGTLGYVVAPTIIASTGITGFSITTSGIVAVTTTASQNVSLWNLSPFQRGWAIEKLLGGMCNNFPVIDKYIKGAGKICSQITSIKSIDLNAASYNKGMHLYNTIMKYAITLSNFESTHWGKHDVIIDSSTVRILEIAIPNNPTQAQLAQMEQAIIDAAKLGIEIIYRTIN